MASSQIAIMRSTFSKLSVKQKKEYIGKLKEQVKSKSNPETRQFLSECIQRYNAEIHKKLPESSSQVDDSLTIATPKAKTKDPLKAVIVALSALLVIALSGGAIYLSSQRNAEDDSNDATATEKENATTITESTETTEIDLAPINVEIDGEPLTLYDQLPIVMDEEVLIPFETFAQLGYIVNWNDKEKTATLSNDSDTIILNANSNSFTTNGSTQNLNVSPQLVNGNLMIPVETVLGKVGFAVSWDKPNRTVFISTPDSKFAPSIASSVQSKQSENSSYIPYHEKTSSIPTQNPTGASSYSSSSGDTIVKFERNDTLELSVGGKYVRRAAATPTGAVFYGSSDENVVHVDSSTGMVTAISVGNATIAAYSNDATDYYDVTVNPTENQTMPIVSATNPTSASPTAPTTPTTEPITTPTTYPTDSRWNYWEQTMPTASATEPTGATEGTEMTTNAYNNEIHDLQDVENNNESGVDRIINALDLTIKALEKEKQALNTNSGTYSKVELSRLEGNLARAKNQKTQSVYVGGQGYVYRSDPEAVRQAQYELDRFKEQYGIEDADTEREMQINECIVMSQEQRSLWQSINAVDPTEPSNTLSETTYYPNSDNFLDFGTWAGIGLSRLSLGVDHNAYWYTINSSGISSYTDSYLTELDNEGWSMIDFVGDFNTTAVIALDNNETMGSIAVINERGLYTLVALVPVN